MLLVQYHSGLIQSFDKYLGTHCTLGTVLGAWCHSLNTRGKNPQPCDVHVLAEVYIQGANQNHHK